MWISMVATFSSFSLKLSFDEPHWCPIGASSLYFLFFSYPLFLISCFVYFPSFYVVTLQWSARCFHNYSKLSLFLFGNIPFYILVSFILEPFLCTFSFLDDTSFLVLTLLFVGYLVVLLTFRATSLIFMPYNLACDSPCFLILRIFSIYISKAIIIQVHH